MLAYIWPIALVVFSNIIYQICSKSVPGGINPLASLTVTYLTAAACSLALFVLLPAPSHDLLREYQKLN